jgi:hypothetical protein
VALRTEFLSRLRRLMERRTDAIRRIVIPSKGTPQKMDRKIRDRLRVDLLDSASQILVRERAKKEFQRLTGQRRLHFISGRGVENRFSDLYFWARSNLRGPIIYSFWKGRKCLYVGKGKSHRRLRGYRNSHYLIAADSVRVWQVRSRNKLPGAECLAVHLFNPTKNTNKPARVKWGRKCPICRRHDELKSDLDSLLRLKA